FVLVVAVENARGANLKFAVFRQAQRDPGQDFSDASGLGSFQWIEADDSSLGQSIAFNQRHADPGIEVGEVPAKWRCSRSCDANPAAQAFAYFREHQLIRGLQQARHPERNGLSGLSILSRLHPQTQRTVEELSRGGRAFAEFCLNSAVHTLPNSRRSE